MKKDRIMKTSVFQIIQPNYWAWKLTSELHCGLNFPVFDVRWSFQPRKDFPRITDSFRRYDHWNFSNCGFLCGIFSVMFGQRKMTSKVNSNKFLPKRHFPNTTIFRRYDPYHRGEKNNYRYLCGIFLENINWKIAISPLKICIFNFGYNEGFILSSLQYSLTVFIHISSQWIELLKKRS